METDEETQRGPENVKWSENKGAKHRKQNGNAEGNVICKVIRNANGNQEWNATKIAK